MLIRPLWEFFWGTWYTASVPDLHDGSIDSFAFGVKNLKIWPFLFFFATFVTFWTLTKTARNSPGLSVWLPWSDLWVLRLGQVCGFSGQTAVHNFFDGTKSIHQPQKKAPPCRLWCILHNWTDHTLTVCSWAAVDLMQWILVANFLHTLSSVRGWGVYAKSVTSSVLNTFCKM